MFPSNIQGKKFVSIYSGDIGEVILIRQYLLGKSLSGCLEGK